MTPSPLFVDVVVAETGVVETSGVVLLLVVEVETGVVEVLVELLVDVPVATVLVEVAQLGSLGKRLQHILVPGDCTQHSGLS